MASSLPYLASNKNIERLFTTILSAKVPDRFTQEFLNGTIGLKGTNDRQAITLLKSLRFLDQSGTPTAAYRLLKSRDSARQAIADGVRVAYAPLFAANEDAHALSNDKLRGLVSQVAGTDDDMTSRIVATLSSLIKQGDFSTPAAGKSQDDEKADEANVEASSGNGTRGSGAAPRPVRPEFHYNIQIHLPNNATEEVYLNVFNALRKTFQ